MLRLLAGLMAGSIKATKHAVEAEKAAKGTPNEMDERRQEHGKVKQCAKKINK